MNAWIFALLSCATMHAAACAQAAGPVHEPLAPATPVVAITTMTTTAQSLPVVASAPRAAEGGEGLMRSANAGTMVATLAPAHVAPQAAAVAEEHPARGVPLLVLGVVLMVGIALRRWFASAQ